MYVLCPTDEPCLQDHKTERRWRRGGFPSIFRNQVNEKSLKRLTIVYTKRKKNNIINSLALSKALNGCNY